MVSLAGRTRVPLFSIVVDLVGWKMLVVTGEGDSRVVVGDLQILEPVTDLPKRFVLRSMVPEAMVVVEVMVPEVVVVVGGRWQEAMVEGGCG
ncbi:hypothetical protein Hanom_Chr16g01438971 [Helianthus anomalus]